MALTAELLDSDCAWMPPTTWHVRGADGRYLLVTVLDLGKHLPAGIPVAHLRLPTGVRVFLADERGQAIDADGDPHNGMTPLHELSDGTHVDGLAAAGYELEV